MEYTEIFYDKGDFSFEVNCSDGLLYLSGQEPFTIKNTEPFILQTAEGFIDFNFDVLNPFTFTQPSP